MGTDKIRPLQPRQVVTWQEILSGIGELTDRFPDVNPAKIASYLAALQHEKIIKFGDQYVINTFFPPFPSRAFEQVFNRGLEHPMMTHVVTTNACHGECSYCSYDAPGKEDLSLEQLQHIIAQLQDLGVPTISFTGGESLLRPDLEEIIASVDDRSSASMFTSGYTPEGPLTLERAKRLKDAGLFLLSISLDHSDREINDRNRFPGAHDAALEAIQNSLDAGLYTVSSIVVTEENFDAVEDYIHYMNELGVNGIRILDVVPSGECITQPPLSLAKRMALVEIHKRFNADDASPQLTTFSHTEGREMFGCGAGGVHHMFVDGEGKLRPCDFVHIVYGDLTREPLPEVYARMREVFEGPDQMCFMKQCRTAIAEALDGRSVMEADEAASVISRVRKCVCPRLYEDS